MKMMVVALAFMPWILILLAAPRGFDVTDEGFYLMSIAYPEDVTATFSMFGAVLHPLYDIAQGNVAWFRSLGALLWFGIALIVAWFTLGFLMEQGARSTLTGFSERTRFQVMLLLASAGALYYGFWVLTPSYNWLTLVGLALFWLGFMLWLKRSPRQGVSSLGTAIFAFAAALIFWAKATSAGLLVLYPLFALIFGREHWLRMLHIKTIIGGLVGLLIGLSLPVLQGISPQIVVSTLAQGIEFQHLLRPDAYSTIGGTLVQGLLQLVYLFTENRYIADAIGLWLLPLIISGLMVRFVKRPAMVQAAGLILTIGLVVNIVVLTLVLSNEVGLWSLNLVLLISIYFLLGYIIQSYLSRSSARKPSLRTIGWMLLIFSLIFVYVFGTSNRYAFQSGLAAYFYLLGLSVLFVRVQEGSINALLLRSIIPVILIANIFLVFTGSLTPYRQNQPVWQMSHSMMVAGHTNRLLVQEDSARYAAELQNMAAAAGFQPATPLIDMTGKSPGVAYLLNARAYGFPWILGGYPGSVPATLFILRQFPAQALERAWLLTGNEDLETHLPVSILTEVSLEFPSGYSVVGTVRSINSTEVQTLWKPVIAGDPE
jgi:hypothetical protein